MSETYGTIEDAEPVKRAARKGAGRKREDNPLETIVKSVLGQRSEDGTPVFKKTTFVLDAENGESEKQRFARVRRLLTRAGKELVEDGQEPAKIERDITGPDESGVYTLTVWHRQN